MKRFSLIVAKTALVVCLGFALFLSCGASSDEPNVLDRDASYALGMFMADVMRSQMGLPYLVFDYNAFRDGFRAFNEAEETRFTYDEAFEIIYEALSRLFAEDDEELWLEGERNREEGEAYLAANAVRPGVMITPSGLQYEVIVQGSGESPLATDVVRVHYEGSFLDGTIFDTTYEDNEPVEFPLSMVIDGWTEGIMLMNEGSTYRLVIPSFLAYGPSGWMGIPPNATLIFTVELLSIVR